VSATCVSFAVTCERGYVTRHREGYDRRRVVVRPTDAALDGTERFLGFAGAEIAAAVRETPDAELRAIRAFLGRMTQAASAANVRLRDAPASARTEA